MRSDLDEPDLYPPDAEELTPDARQHRNRVAAGTALVVWGTALLVQRALHVDLHTFWLGIGLAALAGWSQHRRYSWFVAGAIITGLGLGDLVTGSLDNAFGATLSLLLIGGGFAAIYVRYPRRSGWALPVAAVFALMAVASFGIGLIGLVPAFLGRFLLPLLLIGGGALLLLRHSLPPRTVKVGLAALAVTFVLVGATSVPDIDHEGPVVGVGGPGLVTVDTIPALEGRTLVLRLGSGSVRLEPSEDGLGHVEVSGTGVRHGRSAPVHLQRDGDRLVIDTSGNVFGNASAADYTLRLPAGAAVDLETGSGRITGTLEGLEASLRTGSGDIAVKLLDGGPEGTAGDGPYDFTTGSGDVRIERHLPLALEVDTGTGRIDVDGTTVDGDSYESAGSGVDVEIDTGSGDVLVTTGS